MSRGGASNDFPVFGICGTKIQAGAGSRPSPSNSISLTPQLRSCGGSDRTPVGNPGAPQSAPGFGGYDQVFTIFHAHQTSSSAMTALMALAYFLYSGKSREPRVAQIRLPVPAQSIMITAKAAMWPGWNP